MRKLMLSLAIAAMAVPATPILADPGDHHDNGRHNGWDHNRGNEWQNGRHYDWNRPDTRYGGYDPARYYHQGNYRERRLGRNDRVYRGSDGRYYCRRSDGTTGLIVGGLGGAALGNVIDGGHSRAAGTLIGGALGALLGQSVDRSTDVRCR